MKTFLKWASDKITVGWCEGSLCQCESLDHFDPQSSETPFEFMQRVIDWVHENEFHKDKSTDDEPNEYVFTFFNESLGEEYDKYQEETLNPSQVLECFRKSLGKSSTDLYVLTVESASGCDVLGAHLTEKGAKAAAAEFVDQSFKKKLVRKDSDPQKKLLYEDSKAGKKLFMSIVAFQLPTVKKAKKAKDPNAPKKAMSAFMIFSNEQRNNIKAQNPESSFGEIGRKVGEAWKGLSDKQKQVYVKKAEQDKKRYESEMQTYTSH